MGTLFTQKVNACADDMPSMHSNKLTAQRVVQWRA